MKKILYILFPFIFLYSCHSKRDIKNDYEGFAILKFKTLENDGVDDFTFFLFENNKKFSNQEIPLQSITFPFPQNKKYLVYKLEINKRKFKENDLILVKINYNLLTKNPLEFTKKSVQPLYYRNKKNNIINYSFYNIIDNNGDNLFEIKEIKFIKKL
ncbi:hypothetical protein ACTS95_01615 [Empedobacter brevis]